MITVITKKENELKCTSYKAKKAFKHRGLRFLIYIIINKIRKYEVEVLDDE